MSANYVSLRKEIFSRNWPLDDDLTATAAPLSSHRFLQNPAGQYVYIYLTNYVKALSELHLGRSFCELSLLDWGCGKGQVSKLFRDLGPGRLESCDIQDDTSDSAFGQATPILDHFQLPVTPLPHPIDLPYPDGSFDIVVSFGVLEHVANDAASLAEIARILRPGGLFFCFFLPTRLSWTQAIARAGGDSYHDRLYTRASVERLLRPSGLQLRDLWYRQIFPKNTIYYPAFRLFEQVDQLLTRYTPLCYFATNIEFVAVKPA
jgi:SAM-dependent methyltransferase